MQRNLQSPGAHAVMNSCIFIPFDFIYFLDFYASAVTQRDVVIKKNVLVRSV